MSLPILYSFRRCPYAMRARLGLAEAGIQVRLREIELKNKPEHMVSLSPKGTVPVLYIEESETLIDESLDILTWAIEQCDQKDQWLPEDLKAEILMLVHDQDQNFKGWLDKYKYADRFPEFSEEYYRNQAELFIEKLESRLTQSQYLFSQTPTLADLAIFPFIRQFAHVDIKWWNSNQYTHTQRWLEEWKSSELFASIMKKYKPWLETNTEENFPA